MDYDDFRIEVTPSTDPAMPDRWNAKVISSPNPVFEGYEDINIPVSFTSQMLSDLRDPQGHPKPNLVQASGTAAWQSLMGPNISAAFLALRGNVGTRGLRLVTVLRGKDGAAIGSVNPGELPVEALHHPVHNFIAHDVSTPLVRAFTFSGDYTPGIVTAPLRILLVSASPEDLPPANISDEIAAVEETLKDLIDTNVVRPEKYLQATLADLQNAVNGQTFDIVHFVCHGSRGTGADSYICLINEADKMTKTVDAATLNALFKNSRVRLLLFSACSSAASPAAALADPYPVTAFSGIAQSVLAANNQLGAVIAMQFDFETRAAVQFTKKFYQSLLIDRRSVEESVSVARLAVVAGMGGVAHRAWVTPVIYSRAKAGRLFDLSRLLDAAPLSPAEETQLSGLQKMIDVHVNSLEAMCALPGGSQIPNYAKGFTDLETLRSSAAQLLRVSARLINVSTDKGMTVEMDLRIMTTAEYSVRHLFVKLRFDPSHLRLQAVTSARLTQQPRTNVPFAINTDEAEVFIPLADGALLSVGDQSIATLSFVAPAVPGRFSVEFSRCGVQTATEWKTLQTLSASVFVTATP